MPKRKDPDEVLDLEFLPKKMQSKIKEIFDRYFQLDLKTLDVAKVPDARMPSDIAALNTTELGNLQSKMALLYEYINDKMKYAAVACTVIDDEVQFALDQATIGQIGEKGNVDEKKAQARLDPIYIEMRDYARQIHGLKEMLKTKANSLDKDLATLSREISRREHLPIISE